LLSGRCQRLSSAVGQATVRAIATAGARPSSAGHTRRWGGDEVIGLVLHPADGLELAGGPARLPAVPPRPDSARSLASQAC
jgi:hypothetical protein